MAQPERNLPVETSGAYGKLAYAAELLSLPDPDNHYLSDAAHFARQCNDEAAFGEVTDRRRGMQARALARIGQYAAETGNEALAQYIFSTEPLGSKWQLYAHARRYATLTPNTLGEWQLELERETTQAAYENDPQTRALVEAGQMAVLTIDYKEAIDASEKAAILPRIQLHKTRLFQTVKAFSIDPYTKRAVIDDANLSLAQAGLWQYIEDDRAQPENKDLTQLVVKGLLGQLTMRDRLRVRRDKDPASYVVRWLANRQKGKTTQPPHLGLFTFEDFSGKKLIEDTAPEVASALALTSKHGPSYLRMMLQRGEFEAATSAYAHTTELTDNEARLDAALVMSQHTMDMSAVEPAHAVFGDGLHQSIRAAAALVGGDTDPRIIADRLHELRLEITSLKDPAERIRCKSALVAAQLRLDPNEHKMAGPQWSIEKSWTALEQTGSNPHILASLRDVLASDGIALAPSLKQHESGHHYIGYIPVITAAMNHPRMANRTLELLNDGPTLELIEQTAATLNALLGEDRYIVDTTSETPQLLGSWRTTVNLMSEFHATRNILDAGGSLSIDEALSTALRQALDLPATT